MNSMELALCVSATLCSSLSQLLLKAASSRGSFVQALIPLGTAVVLLICAVLLSVMALRTMNLSRLIPFAAGAYVLVPLGGHVVFGELLRPHFWLGTMLIVVGTLLTHLS